MKKILLLLAVSLMIFACEKDDEKPQKMWDANKMVLIKPDKSAFNLQKRVVNDGHLSALEIVKQAKLLRFKAFYSENKKLKEPQTSATIGIADVQKDLEKPAIKFWSIYIIFENELIRDFTHAENVVICTKTKDTIAYIPNQTLVNAREPIKKAFEEQRYEDVYKMFDELYTFRPITGAEYKELMKEGKQ